MARHAINASAGCVVVVVDVARLLSFRCRANLSALRSRDFYFLFSSLRASRTNETETRKRGEKKSCMQCRRRRRRTWGGQRRICSLHSILLRYCVQLMLMEGIWKFRSNSLVWHTSRRADWKRRGGGGAAETDWERKIDVAIRFAYRTKQRFAMDGANEMRKHHQTPLTTHIHWRVCADIRQEWMGYIAMATTLAVVVASSG